MAAYLGGPTWLAFAGVPSFISEAASAGSSAALLSIAFVVVTLLVWALYGFSGSGKIKALPGLKLVILMIGIVLLAWGAIGVPVLHLQDWDNKYSAFHLFASFYISGLGVCYLLGFLSQK